MLSDATAQLQTPPEEASTGSNEPIFQHPEIKKEIKDQAAATAAPANASQFPPPKTDKPRPHVCGTCGRCFARLEHLKRHERSHTKEKPFECQECTRCFARRDLLLRHQQKLHYQSNPARPKNARRESNSGTSAGGARVRKNSVANNGGNGGAAAAQRPRATTLGSLDLASLGLMDNLPGANSRINELNTSNHHRVSMSGATRPTQLDLRGPSSFPGPRGLFDMPKFDASSAAMDFSETFSNTTPSAANLFDLDQLLTPGGNTINPAQLHFGGSMTSPATHNNMTGFPSFPNTLGGIELDDDFSWIRNWDGQMHPQSNENAIEESSPSRFSSSASQSGFSEAIVDPTSAAAHMSWTPQDVSAQALLNPGSLNLDGLGSGLPNLDSPSATISPHNLHDHLASTETFYEGIMAQSNISDQHMTNGMHYNFQQPSLSNFDPDSPSVSSASMNGSARHSSITSVSTDSITDATRQALLLSLSQTSGFGHGTQRKFSQPSISSPLSPHPAVHGPSLPGTADLQRYINAYVHYFHPHLPFLHIPTLSFDSPDYVNNLRPASAHANVGHAGIVGGGGCLILAMAAIGALHEYDQAISRDLFESAKKMIQSYLEERRRADLSAAVNGHQMLTQEGSTHNTPLWLVQAMLLNVIYGHFSGDKTAADIASTHCAALVSLARAAELARPASNDDADRVKVEAHSPSGSTQYSRLHGQWLRWKEKEERKRTLFAVFILSSLLVTAYNQSPAIMNSEVLLDLPCDEDLWTADSAQEWISRGGSKAAEANAMSFESALLTLLHPNQGQHLSIHDSLRLEQLRPSTFGCLVLINALHNYIWETRSRHHGRQWTAHETDSMFSHIEPALNAWQAAWKATPHHTLERPNPSGRGPLSADSIPLLDLAFVRLFVNLGRSKEAFWARDFNVMAEELARGLEIVQHATGSPESGESTHNQTGASRGSMDGRRSSQAISSGQTSKREKHLRKAAFYAADSLLIASKWNLTFADPASHELPIQSAMCFFDCSQVLAEWGCTVQERVGRYLGILGQAEVDYTQVPAIMLLETEDVELLGKIEHICAMMEEKMIRHANMLRAIDPNAMGELNNMDGLSGLANRGLGSRILKITGLMLEKAAVWPVTQVMASALDFQAEHMTQRGEASITATA
ncbi:hypothetical protein AAFC00_002767 [Neodothiora populina]|uniref:C2H2-type domain-containing protein n=1 Tax=Neodothiora populina TaxID=2781224 RepID=A0ABR3P8W5_9PEZI